MIRLQTGRRKFFRVVGIVSLAISCVIGLSASGLAQSAPLSVDDVIKLHQGGVGENVIVTQIRVANKPTQLAIADLLKLSQAKVPERVIQALQDPTGATQSAAASAPASSTVYIGPGGAVGTSGNDRSSGAATSDRVAAGDPNDPLAPHDSGIYLYAKKVSPEMILLEPAAYSGTKEGGGIMGGIAKATVPGASAVAGVKVHAVIQGNKSSIRAQTRLPEFYFYFEDRSAALGKAGPFGSITSPNQFVLVKLDEKTKTRETTISSATVLGGSTGTDQKAIQPFKSERLKPGLYKITFEKELPSGEYAFMVASGAGGAQQAGAAAAVQIFDFGVPKE